MAPIPQWQDFIGLANMDAKASDDRGQAARDFLAALGRYMQERFTVSDVTLLADLIMSDAVRGAIAGGIAAQEQAQASIEAAATAVKAAVYPPPVV